MAFFIIIFILLVISLVLLIAGIINPSKVIGGRNDYKRVIKTYGTTSGVLLVLFIVTALFTNQSSSNVSTVSASTTTPKVQSQSNLSSNKKVKHSRPKKHPATQTSLSQFVENVVNQAAPNNNLTIDGSSFINMEKFANGVIGINAEAQDNIGYGMIKTGILIDTSKIMENIFSDPQIGTVLLNWHYPETNAYGTQINPLAIQVVLSRQTYNKINWSNFLFNNIPQVADSYQAYSPFH